MSFFVQRLWACAGPLSSAGTRAGRFQQSSPRYFVLEKDISHGVLVLEKGCYRMQWVASRSGPIILFKKKLSLHGVSVKENDVRKMQ